MNHKLPYYMAYPMPFAYDDDKIERRDMEYMQSMYPDIPKRILPYVEEECDRMEYDRSMIYDEYPDKLQLRMMCSRIYENVMKNEKILYGTEYGELLANDRPSHRPPQGRPPQDRPPQGQPPQGRPPQGRPPQNRPPQGQPPQNWLRDLIEVMLYQELFRRRCNNRRCRRFY